jgi:hypothetical protein
MDFEEIHFTRTTVLLAVRWGFEIESSLLMAVQLGSDISVD